jgi:hypothetical protein
MDGRRVQQLSDALSVLICVCCINQASVLAAAAMQLWTSLSKYVQVCALCCFHTCNLQQMMKDIYAAADFSGSFMPLHCQQAVPDTMHSCTSISHVRGFHMLFLARLPDACVQLLSRSACCKQFCT